MTGYAQNQGPSQLPKNPTREWSQTKETVQTAPKVSSPDVEKPPAPAKDQPKTEKEGTVVSSKRLSNSGGRFAALKARLAQAKKKAGPQQVGSAKAASSAFGKKPSDNDGDE